MCDPANDPALVDALLARTPGAARAFIARHDAFLRKAVRSASPASASLVDDLTHDAYVHLWRNDFRVLRQWQREHPLRAYLHTIVTRLAWDRLARLQPAWELVDADPYSAADAIPDPSDPAPTPEDEVAAAELLGLVRQALGQLDDGYCLVLELRYVRDLSYREIADALGITSSNAGVRINRAMSRLRKALPQLVEATDGLRSISGPAVEARL
jgi:RNA polymerase sigma-70 factor (ECF subfamily)